MRFLPLLLLLLLLLTGCQDPPDATVIDRFGRAVSGGWGSADTGGSYTVSHASNCGYAVADGTATMTVTAAPGTCEAMLQDVDELDVDSTVRFRTDKAATGLGYYVVLVVRSHDNGTEYRVFVRLTAAGEVRIEAAETLYGSQFLLDPEVIVSGVTHTPDVWLNLRTRITGSNPTTLQVKVWEDGSEQPAAWHYDATSSLSFVQGSGSVGLRSILSGDVTNAPVVFSFDDWLVNASRAQPVVLDMSMLLPVAQDIVADQVAAWDVSAPTFGLFTASTVFLLVWWMLRIVVALVRQRWSIGD